MWLVLAAACSAFQLDPPRPKDQGTSSNLTVDRGTAAESPPVVATRGGVDAGGVRTSSHSSVPSSIAVTTSGLVDSTSDVDRPVEAGGTSTTSSESGVPYSSPDAGPGCGTACTEPPAPPDPCLGVVCDDPPNGYCQAATEFVAFDTEGSCVDGQCVYTSRSVACDCEGDACLTDPCAGVVCDIPPEPRCNDNGTRTEYSVLGSCEQGGCSYEASFTACEACSGGECYCPAGYSVGKNPGECERCESGTFSDKTNAESCLAQTKCNPGKFVLQSGSTTKDRQCADCEAGTFSPASNLPACSPFTNCQAGQFIAQQGRVDADRSCAACGGRSFSVGENAASCVNWTDCASGQYVSAPGDATHDQTCLACGGNSYSAAVNSSKCTPHTNCTPGQRVSQQGTSRADRQCAACSNGYTTTQNAATCSNFTTCTRGQYIQQQGAPDSDRVCATCPAGTFSVADNVASCTLYTVCGANSVEGTPGTKTSDRSCVCASGFTECSGQCVATASITYYRDGDGDGFGDTTKPTVSCTGMPSGNVANQTDCCDADDRVNPDQTGSFIEESDCGGYDYDCDTVETRSDVTVGSCGASCSCQRGWLGGVPSCGDWGTYALAAPSCDKPLKQQECH